MLKTFLLCGLTFLLVQNYINPTLAEKPSKTLSDKEVELHDELESKEGPVILMRYSVNVYFLDYLKLAAPLRGKRSFLEAKLLYIGGFKVFFTLFSKLI